MNTVPDKWQPTTSGEICEYITSGSRDWKSYYSDHGPLFVRTQDINQDRLDLSEVAHVDLPAKVEGKRSRIQPGDLLVTITGANVGKAAIVPDAIPEAYVSQSVGLMRLKDKRNGPYLHYYLQSEQTGRKQVLNLVYGIGRPVLSLQNLRDIPVSLPPLPEQRRIVAEIEKQFSRLEKGVAALKRVQANLKRYRAAVLKAACEGKLVPTEAELQKSAGKGQKRFESGEQLLKRIIAERRKNWQGRGQYKEPACPDTANLPPPPEGWTWARAEQLCEFITKGTTPSSDKMQAGDGEIPFIKVYNLTFTGALNLDYKPVFISRETHESELARSDVHAGDLLINIVGPPLGQVSIVPPQVKEANMNQAIARFRVIFPSTRKFLAYCLMTDQIISWATRRAKTTAGQSNLTLELCRDLPVPLPPLAEQTRIVAEVERRLSVIDELESVVSANFQRAVRLRQAVLQKAFKGEL